MEQAEVFGFVRERDEAILSLDEKKIKRFCKKYGVYIPESRRAFWAGVHKTIIMLRKATPEQKRYSEEWLTQHGFTTEI